MHSAQNRQYISFEETAMQYDPVKDRFATYVSIFPGFRCLFYKLLDAILLRQAYVKKAINRHFRDGNLFYDAGAGFCQYSDYVLRKYPAAEVFAVDLKTQYLESYAHVADNRFSFHSADLQTYKPQRQYHMAIAIDILEHIEDDLSTLKNFHAALVEGGTLIISTPSDLDEAAKFTEEHVRPGYNKLELEQKLENCGFEALSSRYSYGFWGALSWRLLLKYPLKMYSQSRYSMPLIAVYYLLVFIPARLMMLMDLTGVNNSGTGIIIEARKKH